MNTTTATITPGIYVSGDDRIVVREGRARTVRANGKVSRYVIACLVDGELVPTGNAGPRQRTALAELNAGRGRQTAAHCECCHRELTDPVSIARGRGPGCNDK